jgi:outer membrane beta-barrel protein
LVIAIALVTTSALAGPKKGGGKGGGKGGTTSAPKGGGSGSGSGSGSGGGGDSGEIEMDQPAGGGGGSGAAGSGAGGGSGDAGGEIEMDNDTGKSDLGADLAAADQSNALVKSGPVKKTPVSWKDILVVVRKPFLKVGRTELLPFVATTMNDNMITHRAIGGELSYYLTDVLAVGVEGQYFQHSFNEPFDIVARQARRLPTVNEYKWEAALDFHYVPVYGKFAVLDHRLITWEVAFTAGVGAGQSEVIPRDPKYPGFTNLLIEPNVGGSFRFFLAKWLTINMGVRDYMFIDKFEPTNRSPTMNATASDAKNNADSAFINNIMFQIGIGFWLPTSFEYTTFR